ncbi:hypothetical protein ACFTXM_49800 [Streptomyces sp. NPDC056930]|uniref:hypothetical protein n=1 Tax=unclassified Streptomyces TaxID=2593676 RepID=UPI0036369F43
MLLHVVAVDVITFSTASASGPMIHRPVSGAGRALTQSAARRPAAARTSASPSHGSRGAGSARSMERLGIVMSGY